MTEDVSEAIKIINFDTLTMSAFSKASRVINIETVNPIQCQLG